MSTVTFGVKFILRDKDAPVSENTAIGLYNVTSDNSQIRLVLNAVSGLTPAWATGMLMPDGISPIIRSLDISNGGAVAQDTSVNVKIQNAGQFWKELDSRGILLQGCIMEIWEFVNSTGSRIWYGACEAPNWNGTEYTVNAKTTYYRRIANITTQLADAGKTYPVVFGKLAKAKMIRLTDEETVFVLNSDFVWGYTSTYPITCLTSDNDQGVAFPFISGGTAPTNQFYLALAGANANINWYYNDGTLKALPAGYYSLTELVGKYIHIIEGDGGGQYRYIAEAGITIDNVNNHALWIRLADYLKDPPAYNATATATNQSWCEIVTIDSQFQLDTWKCKEYLDQYYNGLSISTPSLYGYLENKTVQTTTLILDEAEPAFIPIPNWAFAPETGNIDCNKVEINLTHFNDNPNEITGDIIVPVTGISLEMTSTLTQWGFPTWYLKDQGAYRESPFLALNSIISNPERIGDHDSVTSCLFTLESSLSNPADGALSCIKFSLPSIDNDLIFDSVFVLMKFKVLSPNTGMTIQPHLRYRKFMGSSFSALNSIITNNYTNGCMVNSFPDNYWIDPISSSYNIGFYSDSTIFLPFDDTGVIPIGGYFNFEIPNIDTVQKYRALKELALLVYSARASGWDYVYTNIYEVAICFHKNVSIKDTLYTGISGRIYNSTWGDRKVAADLIPDPIDVLEHVCRLQNWSENQVCPTPSGWGLTYAWNALIATTGDGGFDDTDLNSSKLQECCGEILEYNDCFTDKIKQSLCKNFNLISYVDKNGYEKVKNIRIFPEGGTLPTITFGDILRSEAAIEINETDSMRVYCEPFVRYMKNYATGEYEKSILIRNASADNYSAGYVVGKSDTMASKYWGLCHSLWTRVGSIVQPPDDLTNLDWMNGPNADAEAWTYLTNWIERMGHKTIKFSVHYNHSSGGINTRDWEEGQRFMLQLPHETNNVAIECITFSLSKKVFPPYNIDIDAMMVSDWPFPAQESFYIKDTWVNKIDGADEDIQDTYDAGDTNVIDQD